MSQAARPSLRRRGEDWLQAVWRTRGPASALLTPFAWLYGCLSARRLRRQARHAWRAPVPVVVVGNILVGGTGKTPVTAAICQHLRAQGWHPGILSRGYGIAPGATARLSDTATGGAYLGDEPALLHAATGAPVAVHPRRALAAQALLAAHPETDVLIADDGLQHRALARDVEIIVQDARGTGNGRLLPAGPLREPAARLRQAHWLITHLAPGEAPPAQAALADPARCLTLRLAPERLVHLASGQSRTWAQWFAEHGQDPCSAAAGIGQPERFFGMLHQAGLTLAATLGAPDHQAPGAAALRRLPPGPILITAKDGIKYTAPIDPRLWVVYPSAQFSDPRWLAALENDISRIAETRPHKQGNRH